MKSMIFPSSDRFGLSTLAPAPPRTESMQEASLPLGLTCSAGLVRAAAAAAIVRHHTNAVRIINCLRFDGLACLVVMLLACNTKDSARPRSSFKVSDRVVEGVFGMVKLFRCCATCGLPQECYLISKKKAYCEACRAVDWRLAVLSHRHRRLYLAAAACGKSVRRAGRIWQL